MYNSNLQWKNAAIIICGIFASLSVRLPVMALDFGAGSGSQSVQSGGMDSRPDWIVRAELRSSNTDTHDCVTPPSIVQADVVSGSLKQKRQTPYESFWYANGKARGQKQGGKLDIPGGQRVAISVGQSPCVTNSENQAAAGVILHLVLSILLNHDQVAVVILPDATYTAISMELQSRNGRIMSSGEKAPQEAHVTFALESESGRSKQIMYFL